MISSANLYALAKAMVPLYTTMALGYISVKYLRAFTPDQCAGINHFVALYALPLLIFRKVASNNPYKMSGRLLAADTLQKIILLVVLFAWAYWANKRQKKLPRSASSSTPLQWVVTIFSLASSPNMITMGLPLLGGMYGSMLASLMVQIVVLQFCIWYNLIIFLYEYMAAKRAVDLAKGHQVLQEIVIKTDDTIKVAMQDQKESSTEMTQPQQEVCETIIEDAEGDGCESEKSEAETKVTAAEIPNTVVPIPDQPMPEVRPEPTMAVKVVVSMAMKKLLKIPNIHASFLGLIWSLMASKVGIKLPVIVDGSLAIISTTSVGLSMFTAGTFIARQSRFIPCGYSKAILSILIRFIVCPILMALTSLAMGLHGTLFDIAIVQTAVPLAVSSFVHAEEYELHADIISTGIITGNFLSLPFTILYYILTGLYKKVHNDGWN